MENLTIDSFKEKIMDFETHKKDWKFQGKLPAIIDFYADWCAPCKTMVPILDELGQKYNGKIDIYKVDTEDQQELSEMFGIKSLPSILFIPMDGEPQMTVGALPKNKIDDTIKDVLIS